MGVNSDLLNPRPFNLGGISSAGNPQSRIRQQANNARAKGINQIRAFKKLTATGGQQPVEPEVSNTQVTRTATVAPRAAVAPKYAGEILRTHRKLIDNLVDHIMFG